VTRGRFIWLALGVGGFFALPAVMRLAGETGLASDWPRGAQMGLVFFLVSLVIPSALAIAYGLGFLSNETLASRRGDSETRELSVGIFVATFSGSLLVCMGLAFYLELGLGLVQGSGAMLISGLLFVLAATGRPWWLYGTIRRLGWFAAISRDRWMKLVLGVLGSVFIAGSALLSGITSDGSSFERYLDQSLEAADAGDFARARQLMERAVDRDSSQAEARHFLGAICIELKDYDCAVAEATRAVELDPQVATYRFSLGTAMLGDARYADARIEFRHAVFLAPAFERAWLSRARIAHTLGDFAEADSAYAVLQELNPDLLAASPQDQEMWASARAGTD